MGTRGAVGFYRDGITKITYNQYDSYPDGLGISIVNDLEGVSIEKLNEVFDRIVRVSNTERPSKEEIEECKEFSNISVSEHTESDWYCLLRNAQGTLKPYLTSKLRYMIDSQEFIRDSLFCEWAYIFNLDNNKFEVWQGFQEQQNKDRYAKLRPSESGYYSCKLIKEYPISKLPTIEELKKIR